MNLLEQVKMYQYYIMFIKLHHGRSIVTWKNETSQNWANFWAEEWKIGQNSLCATPNFSMRRANLEMILRHFLKSKLSSWYLFRKPCLSTFQPKWNFWIWMSFSPPKLQSPKTGSCWCKRWQKGHFQGVFDPLNHPELDETSKKFLRMHNLS